MPSFDSSISNKRFTGAQLKEYDVPDESGVSRRYEMDENSVQEMQDRMQRNPAEVEREIRAAKEARRTGRERLGEGAKRRIEMLLGMTRTTHTADINGTKFVFQSLKAKEMREAIICAAEYDNTVQSPFEVRKQFLARSIVSVADVDFAQFIGSDTLESKLLFIEELDDALLNRLYDEYLKMVKMAREKFSIKNDDDAKQVVADLKK